MRAPLLLLALLGCGESDPTGTSPVFRVTNSGIERGAEVPAMASYASCTGDFDGDGARDLAVIGSQRAQVLLTQAGTLVAQTPFEIPHKSSSYSASAIT